MTTRRASIRALSLLAIVGFVALLPLARPGRAAAHPLGNFTINRYARIELYRDAVHVFYVLDFAEIPTFQIKPSIDADHDGAISAAELASYARRSRDTYPQAFALTIDGAKAALSPLVEPVARLLPGQGGLDTLRVEMTYTVLSPAPGPGINVAFKDNNFSDRAGWKEIVVRPSEGAVVTGLDAKLTVDRSEALLNYPAETLSSAPDLREVSFSWEPGSGATAPAAGAVAGGEAKGRGCSGFGCLIRRDLSVGVILLSLLAAFGFGALHALGPGHGKTVVAAYLVGSKGTARDAVALGLTVTATHTSTVYLLGFITLPISAYIVPDRLYLYLGVGSGGVVILMGAALFAGRLLQLRRRPAEGAHRHGLFAKAHSHGAATEPVPTSAPEHAHGAPASLVFATTPASPSAVTLRPGGHMGSAAHHLDAQGHGGEHDHPHSHDVDGHPADGTAPRVGWRSLVTLGVAGGLLPCPSAIVVMLAAISIGQVLFGMLLIVAFSLGLAGVLTGIGIAFVVGKHLTQRSRLKRVVERPLVLRLARALPIVSAAAITIAGCAITYQAWSQV
jgi:ABC-type nickel/cobalt efflux system permease component RcnA